MDSHSQQSQLFHHRGSKNDHQLPPHTSHLLPTRSAFFSLESKAATRSSSSVAVARVAFSRASQASSRAAIFFCAQGHARAGFVAGGAAVIAAGGESCGCLIDDPSAMGRSARSTAKTARNAQPRPHLCSSLRLLQLSALAVQPSLPLSQQALPLRNL